MREVLHSTYCYLNTSKTCGLSRKEEYKKKAEIFKMESLLSVFRAEEVHDLNKVSDNLGGVQDVRKCSRY